MSSDPTSSTPGNVEPSTNPALSSPSTSPSAQSDAKPPKSKLTKKRELYQEKDITKLRVIHSNDTIAMKYAMSVAAASVAEFVTYPLDLTKTRLQLQGESAAKNGNGGLPYRGMLRTGLGIAKEEGVRMLWRGILPALCRHAIYTGTRMTAYEQIREHITRNNKKDGFPIWQKVCVGMAAGGFGQLVASPTDLVKTQIQMEGKRRLMGLEPRVNGMSDAFRKILAQGGVIGLWRGCWPNVQRAALVNLGDLSTYDFVKENILKYTQLEDNLLTHCLSSACAGLVGAIMGTPADVVKARIMNQPTDKFGNGLYYKNSVDCLMQTINNEGFRGLYKGFVPCWLRMAPWSLTFWISFEQIRKFSGAKSW